MLQLHILLFLSPARLDALSDSRRIAFSGAFRSQKALKRPVASSRSLQRLFSANGDDDIISNNQDGVRRLNEIRRSANNEKITNDDDDRCLLDTKLKARDRQPPFPEAAYQGWAEKEENLSFNYVSFIDQSILRTYSQQTRLLEPRGYALADQFRSENKAKPPTVDDIAMPQTKYGPIAMFFNWSGLPARAVVGSASYFAFPLIIGVLHEAIFTGATPDSQIDFVELSKLVDSFLPGVAIVLGTYFSLTISILYDRLSSLQKAVDKESSVLAMTLINMVYLFQDDDPEACVEGSQCIADQVRTLVFDSQAREKMGVIYNDPYARILRLLKDYSNQDLCKDAYLLSDLHSAVSQLFRLRSERLTAESKALAPTHFDVMTFLSGLLLAGYALGTVAQAGDGVPSETARVLFAALVVCYTIFYEMAFDLNRPFDGIYQVRRSGAAMHLLQIKQVISTNPVLKDRVDFETVDAAGDAEESGASDDSSSPVSNGSSNDLYECDEACQQRKSQIWYN